MAALPNFILKRLYVKESLLNTPDGYQFSLRNSLGAGTVVGIQGLDIDGTALPVSGIAIVPPVGVPREAAGVNPTSPLPLAAGVAVAFRVKERQLPPGRHLLKLKLLTREMGSLEISVTDTVGDAAVARGAVNAAPAEQTAEAAPVRPLKVTIIGAGSMVFARQLMTDILCTPGLVSGTFSLVDVDPRRLDLAHRIGEAMVKASGRSWKVEASTDRRRMLADADYVINTIEVAGLRNVRHDYDIPLKYGVDQCIGDTIGPGGIFKMLRTGPAWLDILRDIEKLCPKAIVLNHTNPMSAITLLGLRATGLKIVGLCHSVQDTALQLAAYLDVPSEELRFTCAGINHLAWYTSLTYRGDDMYPRLAEKARDPEVYEEDPIRFEVMKHFGAFVTESSGHLSEYLPYFRKRPDLVKKYTREGYKGESGFYANHWPTWRTSGDESIADILDGRSSLAMQRSEEYASVVIEARERGVPHVVHANVLNTGLIDNLPFDDCVEVPVLVDSSGLAPVHFGPLPAQMAALDRAHAAVHDLMVTAVLEKDRTAARHALLLDPLTAAVCSPEECSALFDEMWEAQRRDLAWFDR